jgi:hypothetical protein
MDDPADVSSQNGSGRHTLDECSSTRNRNVELHPMCSARSDFSACPVWKHVG